MSVNSKMTAIADEIRDKTGKTEALNLDQMAESIPEVYKAGQSSMVDESKLIPKTVSGSYISVDDVSELPHSVECKVESVNLLNPANFTGGKIVEFNGVQCWMYQDDANFYKYTDSFKESTQYTLTIMIYRNEGATNNIGLSFVYSDGTSKYHAFDTGKIATFVTAEGKTLARIQGSHAHEKDAYIDLSVSCLHEGTEALSYTPYVSPESVRVTRCGKNLIPYPFNYWSVNDAGITAEDMGDGGILLNGTATGEAYVNFFYNTYLPINCNLTYGVPNGGFVANKYSDSISAEYADRNKFGYIYIKIGTVCDNVIVYPQIEVGSTATEYEPYNGQTLTPNADGAVEGMTSVSPYMNMFADTEGVNIEATYNKSYGYDEAVTRFWNEYTLNNTKGNYGYAFASDSWTEKLLKSIPFPLYIWNAPGLFYYNSVVTDLSDFPIQDGALKVTNCGQLIRSAKSLKKMFCIDGTNTTTFYAIAEEATALESISFVANTVKVSIDLKACPLNKDSIISTVEGLSPTVTGQTLTLKLSAVNTAFETSSGAADGSTSAEFAALVATKTNWTITMI